MNPVSSLVRPHGRPPYRDAHYLAATVEIDPKAMRRFLPRTLRLAAPYRAELFTAYFPDQTYTGPYREAGLFVHVRTGPGSRGRTGVHCPWMLVDDDRALILGREATGYPKRLAEITWDHRDNRITAHAARRGADAVRMTADLGGTDPDAPPIIGRPHRNVTGLLGAAFPRVVAFTPGERPIETRHAAIDLTIGDELRRMGVGSVLLGRLHRVDLTVGRPPIPIRPVSPFHTLRTLSTRVL
ncbi:putative acetoacetate decarboxylase [Actinomadura rubteroloni]|uniref:Putative acetoacetate decarboxylase n=1 Tax=Actinomadura rubteroloni TaxID=1926885 RepID=A0A2P4UM01_9ACTN|nr:acetoacetate decarboxylase family protein [Actinomadura rubteroloni]POM26076.1 putative acetoacetate decarboxylase [Actinomadura rubteroloni]